MMFQEYVNQEEQKYLKESLMKYENEKPMMPDEKAKLPEWVASGHDPYNPREISVGTTLAW